MDAIVEAQPKPSESARFLRPEALPGVEALHATFVTHRYSPHVHETWTVAHVVSGGARFDIGRRTHVAPSGTAFVIPPGAVHTGESASELGYAYRVLYLDLEALSGRSRIELASHGSPPVVIRTQSLARALVRMHGMLGFHGVELEQGEALSDVLGALLEVMAIGAPADVTGATAHPAVQAAREYIHAHWAENFTLDDLARHAAFSRFHLLHRFRDQVGMAPSAYRRALRVQAAQRLLRAGTTPTAVAMECGFYDQAHLNRHFKRMIGVTPTRYAAASK